MSRSCGEIHSVANRVSQIVPNISVMEAMSTDDTNGIVVVE